MRAIIASALFGATLAAACTSPEQTSAPQAGAAQSAAAPSASAPAQPASPAAPPAPPAASEPARAIQEEPLPKLPDPARLPPIPDMGFPPPRPMDEVRAVFRFTAMHPEVSRYVPCFCGCERSGHQDNEDCFVRARAADGSVEWEPHGLS
jgi:hypothetical protein